MPSRATSIAVLAWAMACCGTDPRADGAFDVAEPMDVPEPMDAPDPPADTGNDVGSGTFACTAPIGSPCDGMGRGVCTEWAARVGAGLIEPTATCVQGGTGECARADSCADIEDPSTCRCGAGAACAGGQVCARTSAASPFTCLACRAD